VCLAIEMKFLLIQIGWYMPSMSKFSAMVFIYQTTFTSPFCERIAFLWWLLRDESRSPERLSLSNGYYLFSPVLLLVLFLPPDGTGERGARWNYLRLQAAFCSRNMRGIPKHAVCIGFITSGSLCRESNRNLLQFPSHFIFVYGK